VSTQGIILALLLIMGALFVVLSIVVSMWINDRFENIDERLDEHERRMELMEGVNRNVG